MVEPQFVIKASDRFAVEIIRRHRHFCVLYGLREQALEDMKALEEIQQWQMDNPERVHYPDHKHVPQTSVSVGLFADLRDRLNSRAGMERY